MVGEEGVGEALPGERGWSVKRPGVRSGELKEAQWAEAWWAGGDAGWGKQ